MKCHLTHTPEDGYLLQKTENGLARMWRNWKLRARGWECKMVWLLENSGGGVPKESKGPSNSTLDTHPKELKAGTHRGICTQCSQQHVHNRQKVESTQWNTIQP